MALKFTVLGAEVDRAVLPTAVGGSYFLYAVHPKLGAAYKRESYRHTIAPEYETLIVEWNKSQAERSPWVRSGHPRSHGVTVKQGWAILQDA